MEILQFTQALMKLSAMQSLYNGRILGKFVELIKLIVLIVPQTYVAMASVAFIIANIDNLSRVASPVYVILGAAIAVSISILYYIQSKKVVRLLKEIEALVNESQ